MALKQEIESGIKQAMLAKDKTRLTALRAIKSLILLEETKTSAGSSLTADEEMKLLVKAAKQRKDSADIYNQQGRKDLAEVEEAELAIIEEFLPKQLTEDELKAAISQIISNTGATSAKDMGKVMGVATKELAGKADGKAISAMVKSLLN
ncbi:GatB/YqeY domain-containing protein [Penaeicola halotolerans]|uniref:GatB/YqeY domain-containing protein n=1 Tax=Penaeicola halotolerans TaxID=2793196 RepID=UPI001CF88BF6|nr:GatB/YqeY domain-containing protein [Penaeicola halotolerans]